MCLPRGVPRNLTKHYQKSELPSRYATRQRTITLIAIVAPSYCSFLVGLSWGLVPVTTCTGLSAI